MNELHLYFASPGAMHHRHLPEFDTEQAFEGALLRLSRAERREQRQAQAQHKAAHTAQALQHLLHPLSRWVHPILRAAQ